MTDITDNLAKTIRNFDRLDVLVNGDETATYTNEEGDTNGSLAKQVRAVQGDHLADHLEFEKGTWTPHFITSTGDDFYTATGVQARYSKIGEFVSVTAYFQLIHADIVPTGNLEIRGLPFSVYQGGFGNIYWSSGISFSNGLVPRIQLYQSKMTLRMLNNSGGHVLYVYPDDLTTGTIENLSISGTYITS